MNLDGNLGEVDVLRMLIDLSRRKFTGAVRFEHDAIIKIVYFREGDVLSASTNDPTDAIDETLIRAGKITRDHIRQAVAQRKENETIADSLQNLGFITRKELTWARRVQLVGILRSVAEWGAGSYSIVEGYTPKRDEGTLFHLPQIIVETVVTDPDRERVERQTEAGMAVYEKAADFDERFAHLGLNEDASAVAQRIDGMTPAAGLTIYSSEEPFTVFKLLVALELLGLIKRADKPQVTSEVYEPQVIPEVPAETVESVREEEPPMPVMSYVAAEKGPGARRGILIGLATLVVIGLAGLIIYWRADAIEARAGSRSNSAPALSSSPASEEAKTATLEERAAPSEPVAATDASVPEAVAPEAPGGLASDPLRERYDAMARSFVQQKAFTPYALQVEIVCQTDSVTRALEIGSGNIWFVPIRFRGQPCYRVFWGSYGTRAAAEQAMVEVPRVFTQGTKPVVTEVRQALRP